MKHRKIARHLASALGAAALALSANGVLAWW